MTENPTTAARDEALAMIEVFASVGAEVFDLTITDCHGAKIQFSRAVPLDQFRRSIPSLLDRAASRDLNVIVRPRGRVAYIQLDDVTGAGIERVKPATFLILETSPENYQAWVAAFKEDQGIARQLRHGTGADPSASGATRIAGSLNFKDKYAPNFPRVKITFAAPGLIARKEMLSCFASDPEAARVTARPMTSTGPRRWPSYQRCMEGAPSARDGRRPDISRADFTWCMIAIDWGWSIEETAARLMEESTKARENGKRYALLTAERSAAAIAPRRERR